MTNQGLSVRQRHTVSACNYYDTAAGSDGSMDIVDDDDPRKIMEDSEDNEPNQSDPGIVLRLFYLSLADKIRGGSSSRRMMFELTRRVIAIGIRVGAIDKTYEEAAQVLGTSRQSLHLIGVKVAQRLGMPDHSHPGRARAGKAGARAKNAKERRLI
jgi:hypothetical protein